MKKYILLLFIIIPTVGMGMTSTQSENVHKTAEYWTIKTTKDKRSYHNQIDVFTSSGDHIKSIDTGLSNRFGGQLLHLNDPKRFYYYADIDRKKATLQIYDKKSLEPLAKLNIPNMNVTFVLPAKPPVRVVSLNSDQSKLLMHVGYKKTQKIIVIDVNNGSILHEFTFGKKKTTVNVFNHGDIITVAENSGSKKHLYVFDTNSGKQLFTKTYGSKNLTAEVFGDYLFYSYKTPNQNQPLIKYHVRKLSTMELLDFNFISHTNFSFISPDNSDALYFSGTTTDDDKHLALFKLEAGEFSRLPSGEVKLRPNSMTFNEDQTRLLIVGKKRMTTMSMDTETVSKETSLPFDTTYSFMNKDGSLAYLKEGSGSEVAVVNTSTGQVIDRSGTGRAGVKFGQFMLSAALAGVGMYHGYGIISVKYSDTASTLSRDEKKLFAINSKTNDVTSFNASDLSNRQALATGGGTFFIHQSKHQNAPLTVLSGSKINLINPNTLELIKETEVEMYGGIHLDAELIFNNTDEHVEVYSMKTGELLTTLPVTEADLANSFYIKK